MTKQLIMYNWISHPTILTGRQVDLLPMEALHFRELQILAEDERIWEFLPVHGSNPVEFLASCEDALLQRLRRTQYPFVIKENGTNKLIGSTRLFDLNPRDKSLEIGWTWLHPDYWASGINQECKFLLLQFCFEELQTIRVQLKTSHLN